MSEAQDAPVKQEPNQAENKSRDFTGQKILVATAQKEVGKKLAAIPVKTFAAQSRSFSNQPRVVNFV
ncbi:MAG: hypothetical protein JW991_04415 [Candidatus Pacebacteria bacterium]|nr:hypothetical protein [Candidatus Paceibacterota bacterium]